MHDEILRTATLAGAALLALGLSLGAALAQSGGAPVVGQKDKTFSQEAVTLKAGGSIRFVNDDTVAHNITVREAGGPSRAGALQRPGEESTVAFPNAGEHEVRCAIHPRMRMAVTVQQ
jgi:plastocyanin